MEHSLLDEISMDIQQLPEYTNEDGKEDYLSANDRIKSSSMCYTQMNCHMVIIFFSRKNAPKARGINFIFLEFLKLSRK